MPVFNSEAAINTQLFEGKFNPNADNQQARTTGTSLHRVV
ncbi:hypothetical protein SAMN05216308_102280, partial [Nitrosospira sp. Nsp13]